MGLGEEDNRDKVSFSSHHGNSTYYQHYLSLLVQTLITWLKLAGQISPLSNYSLLPLFVLSKEVTMCSSCFKSRKLYSTSLGWEYIYINYLEFSCQRFISSIYVFISVWARTHIYVALWVIVQYTLFLSPGKNTRVGCHSLLQGIFLI